MTSTPIYDASMHQHETPRRVVLDVPSRVVFRAVVVAATTLLLLYLVFLIRGFIVQLAIAAFIAVAADPLVRRIEARGVSRNKSVLIVMLAAFVALGLAISIFVPPLVDQGQHLTEAGPGIINDLRSNSFYRDIDARFGIVDTVSNEAGELPGVVSEQLIGALSVVAAGIFGAITILFLTLFLLTGGEQAMRGIARVVPKVTERRWWAIIHGAYHGISAYAGGAFVIALMGGTSVAVVAAIMGLPYALPLGLWMMMLEIVPMIGATIGAIPVVIVAFVTGGTIEGLVMVTFVVVYQQVENLIIQPRVQGRAAQLSPLVVFASVIIGSKLLGIVGALFAVPVAGVIQIFVMQIIEQQGSHDVTLPAMHPDGDDETITIEVAGSPRDGANSVTGEDANTDTTLGGVGDEAGPTS